MFGVNRYVFQKMRLVFTLAELALNTDQMLSSYVCVGKLTMAARRSTCKSVPIASLSDKRNATLTFIVSPAGGFLPILIVYAGKAKQSLPHGFVFPKGFPLTQGTVHQS